MSIKAIVYNSAIMRDGSDKDKYGIAIMCDSLDEAKRMVEKAFAEPDGETKCSQSPS